MLKKYDIILFDSDNTLYDHAIHERSALTVAFKKYGTPLTQQLYEIYRGINDDVWKEFEKGIPLDGGPLIERFRRLNKRCGLSLEEDRINSLYISSLGEQCSPFPDSYDVCKALSKTHRLYIITNGTHDVQIKRYEKSPLRPFFSGIFTAADIGVQKPKREYFERVLEKIGGSDKERVIIIGDSLSSDILGGINSGIDTCWFNLHGIENASDIIPTYEIRDIKELLRD